MKKRLSPVNTAAVVLVVLLALFAGEIALSDSELGAKEEPTSTLVKANEIATHNRIGDDSERGLIFLKRAKKITRVSKTLLRYASDRSHQTSLLSSVKTGSYRYISTRYSELLLLYCVLQI